MFVEEENLRTKVKICGLTTLEHARFASGAMADFCGFIFYPKSPRYIKPEEAGAILTWLEGPESVGVFVNEEIDEVNNAALIAGVKYVQLHGDETPEYCQLMEKEIIKAFRIKAEHTIDDIQAMIQPYEGIVTYFLFDTYHESEYGGTGETFNWNLLSEIETETPFLVAGGISKDNVVELVDSCKPFGVDVNSTLEESPGIKDFDKMADFFEVMQGIWEHQEDDY